MVSLLLAIIYLAFISLGLPDSLLGSAWPVMRAELSLPVSYAGIITMIISGGTIVSSLLSDRMTKKLGAGFVTSVSVLLTAAALFGFSVSRNMLMLCLFAIPYGLGAGAVDAALNNYVALNFSSRHMNWLHCFWGVGAAVSPYIMSFALTSVAGWKSGYRYVSVIQFVITAVIFLSLPLWKKRGTDSSSADEIKPIGLKATLSIDGVWLVLVTFFSYCALECTAGLWASSYLAGCRGVSAETAAGFASFFYLGITGGRAYRHRIRLCADISGNNPLDSGQFRQGKLPGGHRNTDGKRICRKHLHAAAVRNAVEIHRYGGLPVLSCDLCGAYACDFPTACKKEGEGLTATSLCT